MSEIDTKESLLAAAKKLFLTRGYAGTSVDAICSQAKVSKGSFYHFFDTKEELALAVLQWSIERSSAIIAAGTFVRMTDPVERAVGYLKHVEKSAETIWKGGCILSTFAIELADTHPKLQKVVAEIFSAVAADVAQQLKPIADLGNGIPSASELADQFLIILEGSIILAKAHRQPERVTKAIRNFRKTLQALLASAAV